MNTLMQRLKVLSGSAERKSAEWLSGAESSTKFLKENAQSSTLVLFASMDAVLIHAVLAPLKNLDPVNQQDLSHDFLRIDDSWRIEHASGGGEPDRVYLAPPMDRQGGTLKGGEKLIFRRSFPFGPSNTLEISQKLVHALNLQFIEERSAYCRLDADGDIEDVIKIHEDNVGDWYDRVTVVTILAKDFAEYMRLADMGMVVFFDFTRTQRGSFNGWSGERHFDFKAPDLFYHGGVMDGHGSYINGRMIVRPSITYDEIVAAHLEERSPTQQQYAIFKAINLKTGERIEVSCDPKAVSNYFQPDSELPLEMSPVFFNAEVLHRYKADPEKYDLEDRSIHCRGTWSLTTFDINSARQVHTYLRYLRMLPYKEQIYCQSFNEWPKGSLSERAIATDFKGDFFYGHDPLNALKHAIIRLNEEEPFGGDHDPKN